MPVELFKTFTFDAAHRLAHLPETHKCHRLHGHTYQVTIHVEGPVDPALGWVMDFADLKRAVDPLVKQLDHHYLNDIPGLEISTTENLAGWLWERLKPALPLLTKIVIHETPTSGCVYRGSGVE